VRHDYFNAQCECHACAERAAVRAVEESIAAELGPVLEQLEREGLDESAAMLRHEIEALALEMKR
jgi:hypothetical protein